MGDTDVGIALRSPRTSIYRSIPPAVEKWVWRVSCSHIILSLATPPLILMNLLMNASEKLKHHQIFLLLQENVQISQCLPHGSK
jgi:hypothetical protein